MQRNDHNRRRTAGPALPSEASVAGSAFYHGGGGENLVRFCFAKNDADLEEACRRLKAVFQRPEAKRGTPIATTR